MNFSVGDFQLGGPLGWVLGAMAVLAPLIYLAMAWRPARRGSRSGIWWMAATYLAAFIVLGVGSSLAAPDPFQPVPTLVFAVLLLGPSLLACAAVLHVAVGRGGGPPGAVAVGLAALVGYLAFPAGVILAVVLVSATMPGH